MSAEATFYFAYGSNMSRARLERRVGAVIDLGWSTLAGFRHAFNKRGGDGTAKGNIVARAGAHVHGVLYRLAPHQLPVLSRYEGGYRVIELDVALRGRTLLGITYIAERPAEGLAPSGRYLDHYASGMREHGLPADYVAEIFAMARGSMRSAGYLGLGSF